jgi:hypothetical protein
VHVLAKNVVERKSRPNEDQIEVYTLEKKEIWKSMRSGGSKLDWRPILFSEDCSVMVLKLVELIYYEEDTAWSIKSNSLTVLKTGKNWSECYYEK